MFPVSEDQFLKKMGGGGGGGARGWGYVVWSRDVCVVACVVLPTTHTGVYVAH